MKLHYFPETDSLYIELNSNVCADAHEIANDVVVDFDAKGNVVGIDIDLASTKVDLKKVDIVALPKPAGKRARLIPPERAAKAVNM